MPFYLITVHLKAERRPNKPGAPSEELRQGIRQWRSPDLDKIYQICSTRCRQKWGDRVIRFSCVMISRYSLEFQAYARGRERKRIA